MNKGAPQQLIPAGVRCVAFVGVAKNCGKTTTLNAALNHRAVCGRVRGLISIGIDGETRDMLIGTQKPKIVVERGDWLVTAQRAIARSEAQLEYVAPLGFSGPLGEVVACRARSAGAVVLAGVRHVADLRHAIDLLQGQGVELVLVDGAYGRSVAARPSVSDAVVVSTGAVIGGDIDRIVEQTAQLVDRLTLPVVEPEWQRELIDEAVTRERALLGGQRMSAKDLAARSALLGLRRQEAWPDEVEAIAIPGLVSDAVAEALLARARTRPRALLVPDGTVLQCKARLFNRLLARWSVRVSQANRLLAVSVNPTSPTGAAVDEASLLETMSRRWPRLKVFNPLRPIATRCV